MYTQSVLSVTRGCNRNYANTARRSSSQQGPSLIDPAAPKSHRHVGPGSRRRHHQRLPWGHDACLIRRGIPCLSIRPYPPERLTLYDRWGPRGGSRTSKALSLLCSPRPSKSFALRIVSCRSSSSYSSSPPTAPPRSREPGGSSPDPRGEVRGGRSGAAMGSLGGGWRAKLSEGGIRLGNSVGVLSLLLVLLAAGSGGAGAGGKVGLPALDVALAFPQATPASLFPPAGEMPPSRCLLLSRFLTEPLMCFDASLAFLQGAKCAAYRYLLLPGGKLRRDEHAAGGPLVPLEFTGTVRNGNGAAVN
ncbi:hypothetical protein HU200_020563 [Digitaria exilis]|uniref:Uncharacterized protein n=1 Tax=Digitaria exilis TaxID=1010633 RepID=A0A835F207_9POAL|nr:hypothetical protein HU200_020563 [Digitaria exilis]